jgi:hypothetical protein
MPRLLIIACLFSIAASNGHSWRAVTANGRTITGPRGSHPPWAQDIVHFVKADYPESLRVKHPIGVGFFKILLNLRTGTVRKVLVKESTGYAAIDASIVAALKQTELKPNRWRALEFEVAIGLGKPPPGV